MVFWVSVVEELVVEGPCMAVADVAPLVGIVGVLDVVVVLAAVVLDTAAVARIGLVAVEDSYFVGAADTAGTVDNPGS